VNQLVNRNIRISPINEELIGRHQRGQWAGAVFCVAAGILVAMMGSAIDGTPRIAAVATGVLAVIFGIWQMIVASRMKKLPRSEPRQ
jgi:drug/metabolite transporter (DMT)-like permease